MFFRLLSTIIESSEEMTQCAENVLSFNVDDHWCMPKSSEEMTQSENNGLSFVVDLFHKRNTSFLVHSCLQKATNQNGASSCQVN